MSFRTCRFCSERGTDFVHYSVRSYAHTKCLVDAKGEDFVLALPVGVLVEVRPLTVSVSFAKRVMAKVA